MNRGFMLDAAGDAVGNNDGRFGAYCLKLNAVSECASVGYGIVMLQSRDPPSEPRESPTPQTPRIHRTPFGPQELAELDLHRYLSLVLSSVSTASVLVSYQYPIGTGISISLVSMSHRGYLIGASPVSASRRYRCQFWVSPGNHQTPSQSPGNH